MQWCRPLLLHTCLQWAHTIRTLPRGDRSTKRVFSLLTLTFDLETHLSEGPNTSSLWIWRKSVEQLPRYLIQKPPSAADRLSSFSFFVPGDLDLWPLTMTFKLIRGRDHTRHHCEFGANPFIGSRDILCTNKQNGWKKSQTALKTEPYLRAVMRRRIENKNQFSRGSSNSPRRQSWLRKGVYGGKDLWITWVLRWKWKRERVMDEDSGASTENDNVTGVGRGE